MRITRSAAGVMAGALLASGCGGRGWIADHPEVAEQARVAPEAFVVPTYERWDGVSTLSGAYQLRAARGIGRRSFDLAVSVQRPDRIDISVLSPTGSIEAYLRANPEEIALWFAEDRVLYRGPASGSAFERALGLGLSATDVVAVFLGYGVDPGGLPPGVTVWDESERRIRTDYGARASLWLHPAQRLFDRVEHRSSRGTANATLEEWMTVAPEGTGDGGADSDSATSYPIPSRVRVAMEPDGVGLTLQLLASPRLNHALPAALFEAQVPRGTTVLLLEELDAQGGLFQRTDPESGEERAGA